MGFLGRLLRFLFWVVVIGWAVRLLGRAIGKAVGPKPAPRATDQVPVTGGKRLVRDPVCGMHLAEELALPLKVNGEVLHFCSDVCRQKYETSLMATAKSA
jgi:YHS domain-containing protein